MQTIVRGGPRDLIALAWFRIGFRPRESLVLIGLHGLRRRSGLIVRVDLPPVAHRAQVARQAADLLRRSGDKEVFALVVSDAEGGPRAGEDGQPVMPHRDVERWLRRDLPRSGIAVVDVLAVGPRSYRTYRCQDTTCCPAEGQPLDDLMDSELSAHMVLSGRRVADAEGDVIADVQPDGRPVLSVADLAAVDPPDVAVVLRRWRELIAAGAQQPDDPVILLRAICDHRLRDALMVSLIPGSGTAPEQLLAGGRDLACGHMLANTPDDGLADRGRRLLAALARVAPPRERAEVLAVLAWLAWWCADAARARLLVDEVLAHRPEHRLAALVAQLLACGVPPEWVPGASARLHPGDVSGSDTETG